MAQQKTFGRRASLPSLPPRQPQPARAESAVARPPTVVSDIPAISSLPLTGKISPSAHDQELHEWKKARWQSYKIPWRQLSWMASLCFGIASLVLPDTVNDNVQWLLYALMAASFYVGFVGRRRKADT
jgi:hypothetical protein